MIRSLFYGVLGLTAAIAIAYVMALQYGLDPFDSQLAMYWGVVLLVSAYITLRIAMILEKRRKAKPPAEPVERPGAQRRRGASPKDSLDARMEARRERVRRAKQKAAEAGDEGG